MALLQVLVAEVLLQAALPLRLLLQLGLHLLPVGLGLHHVLAQHVRLSTTPPQCSGLLLTQLLAPECLLPLF